MMIKELDPDAHEYWSIDEFKKHYMFMDDRDIFYFLNDHKEELSEDFLREYIDVFKDQIMYITNASLDFKREFWDLKHIPNWTVEEWDEKTLNEFKDGDINWNFLMIYNKKVSNEFKRRFKDKAILIEEDCYKA